MRIDLKQEVQELIDTSWQYEEEALLDHACSYPDWLTYYDNDIRKFFAEQDIAEQDIDRLIDDPFWWVDSCLVISHGYFSCSYEFGIIPSIGIEIYIPEKYRKQSVIRAINENTDLYIPDWNKEYGYCSTDLLLVCIDTRKVKEWLSDNPIAKETEKTAVPQCECSIMSENKQER